MKLDLGKRLPETILKSALKKLSWDRLDIWNGYLTPCEFIALLQNGACFPRKADYWDFQNINSVLKQIEAGISSPRWCSIRITSTHPLVGTLSKKHEKQHDPRKVEGI